MIPQSCTYDLTCLLSLQDKICRTSYRSVGRDRKKESIVQNRLKITNCWFNTTNCSVLCVGYGLTETAPIVSATPLVLPSSKVASAGLIVANTELKVSLVVCFIQS